MNKFILISFALLTILSSCSNKIDYEEIHGTWQVSEFRSNTPQISKQLIEGTRNMILNTKYLFNEDSSYQVLSIEESMNESGKWSINPENNMLTLISKDVGHKNEHFEILMLNNSKMEWFQDIGTLGYLKFELEKEN